MYFQYSKSLKDKETRRNIVVDDALLKGENGFLLKEIISDFSLKQSDELLGDCQTTVLASSNEFINENLKTLKESELNKAYLIGDESNSNNVDFASVEHISNEDVPLSLSEWREKVITSDKTVVVKQSKLADTLTKVVSELKLPLRYKRRILSKLPMSLDKLEQEIERDVVFIPFSAVKFLNIEKVSLKLIRKCQLCGIRVEGMPILKTELHDNIENAIHTFKKRILK